MAYKNIEKKNETHRRWREANPERVAAARAKYNEKRRLAREDPAYREIDNKARREGRAARYELHKLRMQTDPEFAAAWREKEKERSRRRRAQETDVQKERRRQLQRNGRGVAPSDETPEERETRLRRVREAHAKRQGEARRKKREEQARIDALTPKVTVVKKRFEPRKMGRFEALSKWYGF